MIRKLWWVPLAMLAVVVQVALWLPPKEAQAQGVLTLALEKPGNPEPTHVLVEGGSDGTTTRRRVVDTSGRSVVAGGAAEGVTQAGAPVPVAGRGFNGVSHSPRYCDKIALFNGSTIGAGASNAVLVAAVATQNIYVCDISLGASTAVAGTAIRLVEGSGAACATSPANVGILQFTTPTAAPTAPNYTPVTVVNPGRVMTATAGDALCLQQAVTTNATTFTGWVHYTQN